MNVISVIALIFSLLGAIDYILGNKFKIGKEFERGFMLFGTMALSMIGMIVLAPFIARLLEPAFGFAARVFHIDPSIIPASVFANDMGGAPLATEVALDEKIGMFNALVVASMMGATVSFTIPFALGVVKPEHHRELFLGILCGVATIPIGCFVSGLICAIPILDLLIDLIPLVIFSALIVCGLLFCPDISVKIFAVFGKIVKILIIVGLMLGIVKFLTGIEVVKNLATIEEGAAVCLNASIFMSGAFPFIAVASKLLSKPLKALGKKMKISEGAAMGFLSTLATNAVTFELVNDMDKKGIVLNSAFAVSGAFTFAGHLAFTIAFNADYVFYVIIGKLVAGVLAVVLASIIYKRIYK